MGAALFLAALVAFRIWQLSSHSAPQLVAEGDYRVERVTDGDTLVLTGGARVRLIGADAPETKYSPRSDGQDQPLARDAFEFTQRAAEGRQVRLTLDKERLDKYGRLLAYVWYVDRDSGEELLLNEELIRAGLAHARLGYSYSESMKRRFRAAQMEAKNSKRGIWAQDVFIQNE